MQAKRRVYEVQEAAKKSTESNKRKRKEGNGPADTGKASDAVEINPILEPLPKWDLVRDILQAGPEHHLFFDE